MPTKQINARLPETLWQQVRAYSRASGLRITAIVARALRDFLALHPIDPRSEM